MRRTRRPVIAISLWFAAGFAVLLSPAAMAASGMLDRIDVKSEAGGHRIYVYLNIPARYRSHAPGDKGQILQIQVLPFAENVEGDEVAVGTETLTWKPTDAVPLTEVEFDRLGPQQGSLIFKFTRSVSYQVEAASDLRSYQVFLPAPLPAGAPDTTQRAVTPAPAKKPPPPTLPPLPEERLNEAMSEAKAAMTAGDYDRAVQLFNKVLQRSALEYAQRPEAQELLGVAREKKGQLAHAKAEYELYLEFYPEGEGADRVRQRLAGIVTARETPADKLREAKAGEQSAPQWDVLGSFSQFWRRDSNVFDRDDVEDDGESIVSQNSLDNILDVRGRLRGDDYSIDARFTGRYLHDFLSDGPGSETRISNMYVDAQDQKRHLSGRMGRQTLSKAGVFDRFDGGYVGYGVNPETVVHLVAGFPVDTDITDGVNSDTYFYGVSVDLGTFAEAWDINAYIIDQVSHDISDRRAIGGEVRYFKDNLSVFSLVDYDISYDTLNLFLFSGNWFITPETSVNWVADYRRSPLLTTNNAIQGQGVDDLSGLKKIYTEDEIRDLALDRTAISRTLTAGVARQLNENFQINGDVTLSNLSGTPSSGGVEGFDGTGNEMFYSVQLTGSSLFVDNDISIVGLRYGDTKTYDEITVDLNTRFPVTADLRVNPRFRVDYRDYNDGDRTRTRFLPSIKADYRWKKQVRLEFEAGREWANDKRDDFTEKNTGYYFSIGYRWDF